MKHSLVRDTIVETASTLFYKKGYNLTGINEIIKEAGIAKATLYSHFKSKEDLCIAYLEFKNTTFLHEIKSFTSKAPKGKKQILALFEFLKSFFNDKDFNGCWCINTISEIPKDNEKIRKEIQKEKYQLITFIEELLTSNFPKLTKKKIPVLAKKIYLLYESAIAESHLHQDPWAIDSAKELCDLILPK
ncbi:MAG: TetR/AcrR family transcriptional regulator [Saprospiraceae bacterium]